MNTKEKIAAISNIVFGTEEVVEEVVEATFLDVKTSDGVVLRVPELTEGEIVKIISEDGENVSGEAEYVLEDGQTLSVDDAGVIVKITEAETEETEEVVEEEVMEVEEEVNPLEARIADLENGLTEILSKFSEVSEELKVSKAEIAKFSKAPAEEEIVVDKKSPVASRKDDALTSLSKYRKNG